MYDCGSLDLSTKDAIPNPLGSGSTFVPGTIFSVISNFRFG